MKTLSKKCHTHMCATGCNKNITCFFMVKIVRQLNNTRIHPYPYFSEPAYTTKSNSIKKTGLKLERVLFLKPNEEYIT